METRKLCWIPGLEELEDEIVLEEFEPYYMDYYTSHYFNCPNQIIETYWQAICKHTIDPDYGKIVVFKDDKNEQGRLVERAITPLYRKHIQKLEQLLSQIYYLKKLEQIDNYNFCRKRFQYERIFLRDEYQTLKSIFDLTDREQKQNFEFIQKTIYTRIQNKENYYEIIRILLSLKSGEWVSNIILPSMGKIVSYQAVEAVHSIAVQKQLIK